MNRNLVAFVVLMFLLMACQPVQGSIQARDSIIGNSNSADNSAFAEAKQVKDVEVWKDDPGKIVMWYINFPPNSDNIIVLQCKGVPVSSTESLEPNVGWPVSGGSGTHWDGWKVPIDGVDTITEEMTGKDGTYGDPVHFRYCMTVDGLYLDIPAMGVPYMVSSGVWTFPPSTLKRDFETEARLLVAEQIIRSGGCVNPDTLEKVECAK